MLCFSFETKLVSSGDQDKWLEAYQDQLDNEFADAWSIITPRLNNGPIAGDALIRVVDRVDVDAVLGYHTLTGGIVVGYVGVQTCLDYGASPSACGSHEALEAAKDPFCNGWFDDATGLSWAFEMADQVEDGEYTHKNGTRLSNFLYPSAFNPQADKSQRFDHLDALSAPFTKTPGGYAIVRRGGAGSETQLGQRPPWKQGSPRLATRLTGLPLTPPP